MLNPGINVPVLVQFGFLSDHLFPNGTSGLDELTVTLPSLMRRVLFQRERKVTLVGAEIC